MRFHGRIRTWCGRFITGVHHIHHSGNGYSNSWVKRGKRQACRRSRRDLLFQLGFPSPPISIQNDVFVDCEAYIYCKAQHSCSRRWGYCSPWGSTNVWPTPLVTLLLLQSVLPPRERDLGRWRPTSTRSVGCLQSFFIRRRRVMSRRKLCLTKSCNLNDGIFIHPVRADYFRAIKRLVDAAWSNSLRYLNQ